MKLNYNPKNENTIGNNFDLYIIMPVFNEELSIQNVINDWYNTLLTYKINFLFIIINDGSTDKTLEIITRDFNTENFIIIDKLNSGHGDSIRFGYELVSKFKNKWILQIDSDGQCETKYFKSFWNVKENYDFIIANRIKRNDGFYRFLFSKICILIYKYFLENTIKDPNVPYRLFKSDLLYICLDKISTRISLQNIAISYKFSKISGIRIKLIEINFPKRIFDKSKINLYGIIRLGINFIVDIHKIK